MLRLLKIEFQKLWLNKMSKALIYISFILPFSILILSSIKINFFGYFTLDLSETKIFEFPYIWHITPFFVSYFKIFFAIVVVFMIGNEYSNRTLKQNLIDGLSKKELILSKFYFLVVYSLAMTAVIFIITLVIGVFNTPSQDLFLDTVLNDTVFIFAYFFKILTFFSFCLFASVLTKRSVFALALLFVVNIVEWITYALLKFEFFNEQIADNVAQFFPFTAMYNLINQPAFRVFNLHEPTNAIATDFAVHWHEFVIAAVWIFIYIFLSYRLLKRRDL
jgi:ABC-2 type transport system permease protein